MLSGVPRIHLKRQSGQANVAVTIVPTTVYTSTQIHRTTGYAKVALGAKSSEARAEMMFHSQYVSLFQMDATTRAYPDLNAELEAVSKRLKGMSVHGVAPDNDQEAQEFEARAQRFSLTTQRWTCVAGDSSELIVFALYPDQEWRIALYKASCEALFTYDWSDSAEFQHSLILGYTREQAARWIEAHRRRSASWNGTTMFVAMTESQMASTLELYGRSLPYNNSPPMVAIYQLDRHRVMRETVNDMLPPSVRVARFSVAAGSISDIFGEEGAVDALMCRQCTDEALKKINGRLTSAVQFKTTSGWLTYEQISAISASAVARV